MEEKNDGILSKSDNVEKTKHRSNRYEVQDDEELDVNEVELRADEVLEGVLLPES